MGLMHCGSLAAVFVERMIKILVPGGRGPGLDTR
jgi:hypothetical protein